jgi:hypothetical protein
MISWDPALTFSFIFGHDMSDEAWWLTIYRRIFPFLAFPSFIFVTHAYIKGDSIKESHNSKYIAMKQHDTPSHISKLAISSLPK